MSVVNDDFPYVANGVFMDEFVGGAIAAVRGRFIVHQDLDLSPLSRGLHRTRVFDVYGERLLHHHRDAMAGAGVDHAAMVEWIWLEENAFRVCFFEALRHT